jgi:three-Cys-motif partner protein
VTVAERWSPHYSAQTYCIRSAIDACPYPDDAWPVYDGEQQNICSMRADCGREMLPDDDLDKWVYDEHTRGKHEILIRYMKAWLPILGTLSRQLVIVDAFAGRGRYTTDEAGSPLLLRDIAGRVASDHRVDEVELHFIEKNDANFAKLTSELQAADRLHGVSQRAPIRGEFERVAPEIVAEIKAFPRPSFWFIDPYGFSGLPLSLINSILDLSQSRPSRSEVLITLMVRDINRFLRNPNHQKAHAALLGMPESDLQNEIARLEAGSRRVQALRDLYVRRLESTAGRRTRYVTSAGVNARGATDVIYFLVHATTSPKGKREMKEAIWIATGGLNAVIGNRLEAETAGQIEMFSGETRNAIVDYPALRVLLMERFAGRSIEHKALQDEAVIGHDFDGFIDDHIRTALDGLASQGVVTKRRNGSPSSRRVADGDILQFKSR